MSAESRRLRKLMDVLEWTPKSVAKGLNTLLSDDPVEAGHVRGWRTANRTFTDYMAAAVAFLYEPDPRGAFDYLMGRTLTVRGISVDLTPDPPTPLERATTAIRDVKHVQRTIRRSGRRDDGSQESRRRKGE